MIDIDSKVIYSHDSKRFNNVIFSLLNKKVFDINKYDDFYALDIALSFCESNMYGDFLEFALGSGDIDVKEEAKKEKNKVTVKRTPDYPNSPPSAKIKNRVQRTPME